MLYWVNFQSLILLLLACYHSNVASMIAFFWIKILHNINFDKYDCLVLVNMSLVVKSHATCIFFLIPAVFFM